jgi:Protein of unknown function (DUF3108)
VKHLVFALVALTSCASWKQKDFVKELNKPSEEINASGAASTPTDVKLLEKFEVQTVEEKKEDNVLSEKSVTIKPAVKTSSKKIEKKKITETPLEKTTSLPKDYPQELVDINSRAKKVWDVYQSNHHIGQTVYLDIHYLGMTVGKIVLINKGKKVVNDKEVWHFHARFKSAPFYSKIYELDDTVDTYVTTDSFLSNRYSLVQRESKQDIDDLQLHDRDQLKTFWFYRQKRSGEKEKNKKVEKPMPYFSTDPFSVVFFYQGLPLKNGDVYEIPLVNKGKILILKSLVEGRETIETEKGKRKAIRVHATTKYTGETLKSGDLYFWFSDDQQRTFLKAQAKIKIGSVTADIVNK